MKPIIKFNNGRGAILCNRCRTIIKEDLTKAETQGQTNLLLCDSCKNKSLITKYQEWLKLRHNNSKSLCYCGHTKYCDCIDPDFDTFKHALENGHIKLDDPNNGWTKIK